MTTECPKCGYKRQPSDTAPSYECPECGIVYEKYLRRNVDPPESMSSNVGRMEQKAPSTRLYSIFFILVILLASGWYFLDFSEEEASLSMEDQSSSIEVQNSLPGQVANDSQPVAPKVNGKTSTSEEEKCGKYLEEHVEIYEQLEGSFSELVSLLDSNPLKVKKELNQVIGAAGIQYHTVGNFSVFGKCQDGTKQEISALADKFNELWAAASCTQNYAFCLYLYRGAIQRQGQQKLPSITNALNNINYLINDSNICKKQPDLLGLAEQYKSELEDLKSKLSR